MTIVVTPSALCARLIDHIRSTPDGPAIIDRQDRLSFEQLGAMVAATQIDLIRPAAPRSIGLFAMPSTELVAGAWAALCSGVPYVPLSPLYPDERVRHMVIDSGADLVLTTPALRPGVEAILDGIDVRIDEIATGTADLVPHNEASDDALAYILYTSGSTGRPKGVEVSHRALGHQLDWTRQALELNTGARIVHKTPISFDAAQWEFLANGVGATVVTAEADGYRDPQSLIETIRRNEVTHLQVVPTLLQALSEDPDLSACSSLRMLASGGEALPQRLAAEVTAALPGAHVVNLYGPTETTINAAWHVIEAGAPHQPDDDGTVPIGQPISGLSFHLLDEHGEFTTGSGELAVAGPQLAAGYRNREPETAERFIVRTVEGARTRLYRTGDLVENIGGTYHFRGRTDSQVKIRGHRIELDEIRSTLDNHEWVRHSGVFTVDRGAGSPPQLTAYVELNPHEAALMDQGVHGAHHQSKASRVQVHAQVAGLGVRDDHNAAAVEIPVRPEDDLALHQLAFGRKSFRTFHTTTTDLADLGRLTGLIGTPIEWEQQFPDPWTWNSAALMLRSLVQYTSESRLLPKYAYASPGALYGVQVYVEVSGFPALDDGVYYLNPRTATMHLVSRSAGWPDRAGDPPQLSMVLIGQRSVISSVYSTNVDEVLRFEAGHILGLLDTVAPAAGYRIGTALRDGGDEALLDGDPGDRFVIGRWPLIPAADRDADPLASVSARIELLVGDPDQVGLYERSAAGLVRTQQEPVIRRKDVIAINQRVHDQASFALLLTGDGGLDSYVDLGRALQRAEMNNLQLGLMSSGYSSASGRDLPAARRIRAALGQRAGSSYVAIGGPVTAEQIAHTGMDEDKLHTQGPTEIIATDAANLLPHYMIPDVIRIVDELPRTPNGKIDVRALRTLEETWLKDAGPARMYVPPASSLEHQLAQLWQDVLHSSERVSTAASFFALGGNSITAVRLAKEIRARLGVAVPVQAIFEHDTVTKQAAALQAATISDLSRAVPLAGAGSNAVFMWPGLGGYPMNLRPLAGEVIGPNCRCYGFAAHGINEGESIDDTIVAMARRDIEQLKKIQPTGPYNLIGYSFGARVAFEAAHQLESAGDAVDRVILLAPGSPKLPAEPRGHHALGNYADGRFVRVLYSVFFAKTQGEHADEVVATADDRDTFLSAIASEVAIDHRLAERIVKLVEQTYSFEYTFAELRDRRIRAAVTVIRAAGDDYSFVDSIEGAVDYTRHLEADHYQILQQPQVAATAAAVVEALNRPTITELPLETSRMPHVTIKHFPASLPADDVAAFVEQLSSLVCATFDVADSAVSVALEAVERGDWDADVYQPEIVHRKQFLVKAPRY